MPSPLTGQVALTASAQPLSSTAVNVTAFTVKASSGNSNFAYLGSSTVTGSTGHELAPGESFVYERSSLHGQNIYPLGPADLYVLGSAGDTITWFASPSAS